MCCILPYHVNEGLHELFVALGLVEGGLVILFVSVLDLGDEGVDEVPLGSDSEKNFSLSCLEIPFVKEKFPSL